LIKSFLIPETKYSEAKSTSKRSTLVIDEGNVITATTKNVVSSDVKPIVKLTKSGNRQIYSCSVVGCSFSSVYSKDLVRHMRTHTGFYLVKTTDSLICFFDESLLTLLKNRKMIEKIMAFLPMAFLPMVLKHQSLWGVLILLGYERMD
jgi:hypothetical protein